MLLESLVSFGRWLIHCTMNTIQRECCFLCITHCPDPDASILLSISITGHRPLLRSTFPLGMRQRRVFCGIWSVELGE